MYILKDKENKYICPIEKTLDLIGGKWKPIILWELVKQDILRYGELKRRTPGITDKMLSQQLKSLEKDELIIRREYDEIPLRVEYSLTEKGKTLIPLLKEMCSWGNSLIDKK